jgi:Beta-lactamase superfamily domain
MLRHSAMFQATFLGHQGWLFETPTTRVLVDPLLTASFGHGGAVGVVYPPRGLDLEGFSPIDAVVLTHEHDDHFDVPSLNRLGREIPIHLSSRSSAAAHALLREMGFEVHALGSEQTLVLGDLRYRTFAVDHRHGPEHDEWDVFPFVLHDTAGHGSFASSIDVRLAADVLARMRSSVPRPGIWGYANNVTSAAFQAVHQPSHALPSDEEALVGVARRRLEELEREWGMPAAVLVCGGGWSHPGERAWLDHHAFPLSAERLCAGLAAQHPEGCVVAPAPGYTLTLRDGRIAAHEDRRSFITALPREQWPARDFRGDHARLTDYAPACGRRTLDPGALERLLHELRDFARYLYGTAAFRSLCSLPTDPPQGPRPAFCFALRHGDGGPRLVLRHDPGTCAFVPHEHHDPIAEFMAGIECWATDLLAFLEGELGPTGLCAAGRLRQWSHDPGRLRVSAHDLWMFGHPLRRPHATAALYRRLLLAEPPVVPRIAGRRRRWL